MLAQCHVVEPCRPDRYPILNSYGKYLFCLMIGFATLFTFDMNTLPKLDSIFFAAELAQATSSQNTCQRYDFFRITAWRFKNRFFMIISIFVQKNVNPLLSDVLGFMNYLPLFNFQILLSSAQSLPIVLPHVFKFIHVSKLSIF